MGKPVEFVDNEEYKGKYTFAIIIARLNGQWLFVKHRERETWELPAGHVEEGETVDQAADRELREETGAEVFDLSPLVSYRGNLHGKTVYGRIFKADIKELGPIPESEIAEVRLFDDIPSNLTYPDIQPLFIDWFVENC
jgi:8-oxo-dGTP diphosphatase